MNNKTPESIIKNIIINEMSAWRPREDFLTPWQSPADNKKFIEDQYKLGKYKRGQLKQSSARFANGKDKTGGYHKRVVINRSWQDPDIPGVTEQPAPINNDFKHKPRRLRDDNERTTAIETVDAATNFVATQLILATQRGEEIDELNGVSLVWRSPVPERDVMTWASWVIMKCVQSRIKLSNEQILSLMKKCSSIDDLKEAAKNYADMFGEGDDDFFA